MKKLIQQELERIQKDKETKRQICHNITLSGDEKVEICLCGQSYDDNIYDDWRWNNH